MNRLEDKIAIITGGARNIGYAISVLFAKEGAKVCIFDIDDNMGEKVSREINENGFEAIYVKTDVTNVESINKSVKFIQEKYGKIDILVNNVGASKGFTLEDIDEETFNYNINNNLKSAFFCTKAVLPQMKMNNKGNIVFISSINAILGGFSEVAYSSSKIALHSLVKTLTADYSQYGIRFNVVCPGSIPGDSLTWKNREGNKPGMLKKLANIYPLGRFGDANDVAYAVLFLASDEASWISGVILPVDGGISATGRLPGNCWWENI